LKGNGQTSVSNAFIKLPNQKKCSSPSVRNKYSKCIRSIRTGSLILESNTCTR
jgi:hypothetical protein